MAKKRLNSSEVSGLVADSVVESAEQIIKRFLDKMKIETLKRDEVTLTIGEVVNLMNQGKWNSDTAYQRTERASWLTPDHDNQIFGVVFSGQGWGSICVNKLESGGFEVIDGGHRSRWMGRAAAGSISFDGLRLADNPILLDYFLKIELPVTVFYGLDDSTCAAIFEDLNGGVSLSPIEQRRGRVGFIVLDQLCKDAVKALLPVLPGAAGKNPRRESAEEIILQSIAGNLGCRDYSGRAVINYLLANQNKAVESLVKVAQNVSAFVADYKNDTEATTKKALRKSVLNVLLAQDEPLDFSHLAGFFSHAGVDQDTFKDAAQNATATVKAVSTRFEIMQKIANNTYTKGELKSKAGKAAPAAGVLPAGVVVKVGLPGAADTASKASKKTSKAGKAGGLAGVVDSALAADNQATGAAGGQDAAGFPPIDGLPLSISKLVQDTWGGRVSDRDAVACFKYCEKMGGSDFLPRLDDNEPCFSMVSKYGHEVVSVKRALMIG